MNALLMLVVVSFSCTALSTNRGEGRRSVGVDIPRTLLGSQSWIRPKRYIFRVTREADYEVAVLAVMNTNRLFLQGEKGRVKAGGYICVIGAVRNRLDTYVVGYVTPNSGATRDKYLPSMTYLCMSRDQILASSPVYNLDFDGIEHFGEMCHGLVRP